MSYVKQTESTALFNIRQAPTSHTRNDNHAIPSVVGSPRVKNARVEATNIFAPPSKLRSPARGLSASTELSRIPLRQQPTRNDPAFVLYGGGASKQPVEYQPHPSPVVHHTRSRYAHHTSLAAPPVHSTPRPADTSNSERRVRAMQLGVFKITEAELKERYQFIKEIGAGEWGSIWAVEVLKPMDHLPIHATRQRQILDSNGDLAYSVDGSDEFRPIAVKLCKREGKFASAARTKRLWNEFKVLRTLMDQLSRVDQVDQNGEVAAAWHPNIVNFFEFVLTPTLAMVAMPIYDEPMKVCLPESVCRVYYQQLLSAVHWLHQHGITHNDIKADNLLVTFDTSGLGRDVVTLVDFGFANKYDSAMSDAFMSSDVWGTPEYLAPERIRGELHDERLSDVWALGITFFEIFTGRTPFERHDERFNSKDKFEEYYQRAERGVWLGEWDLPTKMEDLIRMMLDIHPSKRIDAAGALLHSQFDPGLSSPRDSMDELLQLPYDGAYTGTLRHDALIAASCDMTNETDEMFGEILGQTEQLCLSSNASQTSLHASPGVGRSAARSQARKFAMSPSLSLCGMDSRMTDLMTASPPWKRTHSPRRGVPAASTLRRDLNTEEVTKDERPACADKQNGTTKPVDVPSSAGAPTSTPTKRDSVFKSKIPALASRKVDEAVQDPADSQKLATSAKAALAKKTSPSRQASLARSAAGTTVASLAKRFDSSNLLPLYPVQVARVKGDGIRGLAHKRSKSYTLAQKSVERRSIRHSTGASHIDTMVAVEPAQLASKVMRARLFGQDRLMPAKDGRASRVTQTDSTLDSAVLRTFDMVESPKLSRPHSLVSRSTAADLASPVRLGHADSDTINRTPTKIAVKEGGDEIIVTKLRKMASLASMLTKMIDETKLTILSPARKALLSPKPSISCSHSDAIPHGSLSETNDEALDDTSATTEKDTALVSASYSLDLSGTQQASVALAISTPHPNTHLGHLAEEVRTSPSRAKVEGMYASFLLSQNVSQVGSGYQSPTAANIETAAPAGRQRSLASLFVVPSSPTFTNLLEKYGEHPKRLRKASEASALVKKPNKGVNTRSDQTLRPKTAHLTSPDTRSQTIRQSIALGNTTFEIVHPTKQSVSRNTFVSTDDETTSSSSRMFVTEQVPSAKLHRVSARKLGGPKSAASTGGRSRLGRLFRLVS